MTSRWSRSRCPRPLRGALAVGVVAAALFPPACGSEATPAVVGAAPEAAAARAASDPRVRDIVEALEAGLPDAAWTLLERLEGSLGLEGCLLRARACLLEGDGVGALREMAEARELAPADPRRFATEAEVLASLDRIEGARDVLQEGLQEVGLTAELERARGVLFLRTPGAGREALAALERALQLDAELPFVGFPLAQARMLAGRIELGDGNHERALELVRRARAFDPKNPDYRELEAEVLTALLQFRPALQLYAGLEADGRPLGETRALLHQRFATHLLVFEKDRSAAIEQYLAARELGLTEEALGFGATVLAEEAARAIEDGLARYESGELDAAQELFERAIELAPGSVEAHNHLGVCRFRLEDYVGAARAWSEVLSLSEAAELPDPVHLNLARAWRMASEVGRARAVLVGYLEEQPGGVWESETRELLERLDALPGE